MNSKKSFAFASLIFITTHFKFTIWLTGEFRKTAQKSNDPGIFYRGEIPSFQLRFYNFIS